MSDGKFDGFSHEELYAMIEHAKPEHVTRAGSALTSAGQGLNALSLLLKHHIDRVHWEGEGGEAFRKWGSEMTNQAGRLALHVMGVGTSVSNAGDGLTEIKSAMPVPTMEPCYADPEKEKTRLANSEEHRRVAADLMRKLDSYYSAAQTDIRGLKEPSFPLLPPGMVRSEESERRYADSGAGGTTGGIGPGRDGGATVSPVAEPGGTMSARPAHPPTGRTDRSSHPAVDLPTHTNVDSTAVTPKPHVPAGPDDVSRTPDGPGNPRGVPGPRDVLAPRPVPSMPSTGQVAHTVPRFPGGSSDSRVATPRPVGRAPVSGSDGVVGGIPARPGTQPGVARPSRGVIVGDERVAVGPKPAGPGAVAGEGNGATGKGPMGMGHPAAGAGPSVPRQTSLGRRFASEPGGVVGDLRGKSQGRSEFTPGGTGLVRGSQGATGMPLANGAVPGNSKRRQGAQRPDYLVEDEETWSGGQRNTVPRVIE